MDEKISDSSKNQIVNNNDIENLINLILTTSENANSPNHKKFLFNLIKEEENEIKLITNLLIILSNFNQCINKLSSLQNLYLVIYINKILSKLKSKPKLIQIKDLENYVIEGINFYLNFNFNNNNEKENFNKIKKIFDEIILSLFDLIIVMKEPKNFLEYIYNKIILIYLNANNNKPNYILSHESIIKFIYIYESFSRIYLIYIKKSEEIKIIFDKYLDILKFCKIFIANNTININIKEEINELNAKVINQCILSFSKTTMLSLEHFIKSHIFSVSPELKGNEESINNKFIFVNDNSFLEFISSCFNYDSNNISNINIINTNIIPFGLEYANNKEKKFDFLISKGKGILIEVLFVIDKKLTKYDMFYSYEIFNSFTFNFFCNIIEYLFNFYKSGNYPREKANNSPEEIIQLSVIVKIINFIDEIIYNPLYQKLFESNEYKINSFNKKEKFEEIFKYIIVPNLLLTDLEKSFFESDKEEYSKNLLDMCHLCEVKLPKQKSIKLLMTLCDTLDELLPYIVQTYILILKNISLNNNSKSSIKSNIEIEEKYKNKTLYLFLTQNLNEFNLIEQSLQILTSLSYLIVDNQEISEYFCDEIDVINYMLIKITDPLLKSKLCAFYSYNLEILFHNDDEVLSKSFDDSLNFVFGCLLNKESNESLKKTAFNCINVIIFNNYLKKFCVTSVSIYSIEVINYFNIKENLIGYEEEFNEFLKGIMKEYMIDFGDSIIILFDLFWNKFIESLNKIVKDEGDIQVKKVLNDKTKEVNQEMELINNVNIIKKFLNLVSNKNVDIKNNIYEKILSLFPKLSYIIDIDFEEEILQLISKVIFNVKLLPESYYIHFKNYFNSLNKVISNDDSKNNNNDFRYNIQNYHLDFIFTCLQSFKSNIISKENTKEILINSINSRLLNIRRCVAIRLIYNEHYVYCDMGLCLNLFFFKNFTNSEIINLTEIFYGRMEKIPNTDFCLNVKLIINIFLLLIQNDNFDIYDEVFKNNKTINLYDFLCKIISFLPLKDLCLIQHEIISIFCSAIIKYLIIKQKKCEKILTTKGKDVSDIDVQKIYYYILSLNLNQLNIIKNISINIMNKNELKEEKKLQKNLQKEIIIDSYDRNDIKDKNNFKKNTKTVYKERAPHNYSIFKKYDYFNEDIDYKANEDDFLINNENTESDNDDNYDDENIPPKNNKDIDIEDDVSDDIDALYDENNDIDDRDEDFLRVKEENKNLFLYYYNKYANDEIIVYLKRINVFRLFENVMKEIEIYDINFYNQLLNQIKTSQGEIKLRLIQEYKGLQKIEFKDKNTFSYRKILKIQKK